MRHWRAVSYVQGKVDQALLWMFRGVPLILDEDKHVDLGS